MIPNTSIQKTDGNLGIALATERVLAIIGTATSGAFNTGVPVTNKTDLVAAFTSGPLVEACAYMLARGVPCIAFRGNPTTAGTNGAIITTGKLGTATVTATGVPAGRYDVQVKIVNGGALGTAGITYIYSFDNGVNWSAETALGTGLIMTLGRGVVFTLASSTSTLLANDTWSMPTVEPKLLTGDLATSFTALTDYSGDWLRVLVLADADSTILGQCDSFAKSFWSQGKYPEVITCTRPRNLVTPETRSTYLTALAAITAAVQSTEVSCCADQCEVVSEIDGKRLRMPTSIPFAARLMINDDSRDAAAKADGALPGVFLANVYGSRDYHDEMRYPGLDGLGLTTLRTWGGRPVTPGAYVNNPRLLAGPSSDFQYFQLSAILNRAIEKSYALMSIMLSQSVLVDAATGKIREAVAKAIEDAATADLRSEFSDPGRVSGIRLVVSRLDNILVTNTVSFDVQLQPLGYVKKLTGKAGLVRVLPN